MEGLPQLFMRKESLKDLPLLSERVGPLPCGVSIHTHRPGEEQDWEALMQKCFGHVFDYQKSMVDMGRYSPSCVFYLEENGKNIASAAAVENAAFPGEGWLHFVGVDPQSQGRGLSKYVVLAVLYACYARGCRSVVLSTDDFRIPAIKSYLKMGFQPLMNHESHRERWETVMKKL